VANNNYPQITSVTSEALQAQIRNLLPSQEGFGTDLMAQNVIVPIIDLTSAAEGSSVLENLQTAINFGGSTAFDVQAATSTIVNNTGFFRITGSMTCSPVGGPTNPSVVLNMTDGVSTKKLYGVFTSSTAGNAVSLAFDEVFFLDAGESVIAVVSANASFIGSSRQLADVNGVLVNPVGFNPQ
jgi:hypothetical protein